MTAFITTLVMEIIIVVGLIEQSLFSYGRPVQSSASSKLQVLWAGFEGKVVIVWAVLTMALTDLAFIMMSLSTPRIKLGNQIISLESSGLSSGIKTSLVVGILRTCLSVMLARLWPLKAGLFFFMGLQAMISMLAYFVAIAIFPPLAGNVRSRLKIALQTGFLAAIVNSLTGIIYIMTLSKYVFPGTAYSIFPLAASSTFGYLTRKNREMHRSTVMEAIRLESEGNLTDTGVSISRVGFVRDLNYLDPEEAYELGHASLPFVLMSLYNVQTWYLAFTSTSGAFYLYVAIGVLLHMLYNGMTNRMRRRKEFLDISTEMTENDSLDGIFIEEAPILESKSVEMSGDAENPEAQQPPHLRLSGNLMTVTPSLIVDANDTADAAYSQLPTLINDYSSKESGMDEEYREGGGPRNSLLLAHPSRPEHTSSRSGRLNDYLSAAPSRKNSFLASGDIYDLSLRFSEDGRNDACSFISADRSRAPSILNSLDADTSMKRSACPSIMIASEKAGDMILNPIRVIDRIGDHAADAFISKANNIKSILQKKPTTTAKASSSMRSTACPFRLRDFLVMEAARFLADLTGTYVSIMTVGVLGMTFFAKDALFSPEDSERCSNGLMR
ncbi:hypothetical protein HDU67_007192, partial [Dinochytrium kinnereticum]